LNNFYIYIYLDPRKSGRYLYENFSFLYKPFYVGKGSSGRCKEIKWSRNPHFKNKINSIKKLGLEPIIFKLYENLDEYYSFEKEIELISEIGRIDLGTGPLVNMTDGGEGMSGHILSEDSKNKISNGNKNKYVSEETRNKMRKKSLNRSHSKEIRKKIGENNPNSKKIKQKIFDIKIDIEKKELSQIKIAKKYGFSRSTIQKIKYGKFNYILGETI
jgi:predicted XRE-type DNA-binding protein